MSQTTVSAYGLARPDLTTAHDALARIFGADVTPIWLELLDAAEVANATAADDASFERVLAAIEGSERPVVRLCGRALRIRWQSYRHLAAAQAQVERY